MSGGIVVIIYIAGFFLTWLGLKIADELGKRDWYAVEGDSCGTWVAILFWFIFIFSLIIAKIWRILIWIMNKISKEVALFIQHYMRM